MEKVLALIETILAFWLAYPASLAFGKVLLQTAPPQDTVQMLALKKAIREVSSIHVQSGVPSHHQSSFKGRGTSFRHTCIAAACLAVDSA